MSLYLYIAIKSLAMTLKEWYITIKANVLNMYSSEVINSNLNFNMSINGSTFYDRALEMLLQ